MLLLLTGSGDGTADLIVAEFPGALFRFNFDLFNSYKLEFRPNYWKIEDPTGRCITSETVSCAFWWKAFNFYIIDQDPMIKEEIKYIFKDIYGWCAHRGFVKGNAPDWHNRYGKMSILGLASEFFEIPDTLVSFNLAGVSEFIDKSVVAKSLSSSMTASKNALFTVEVPIDKLHPDYPWYLQEKVNSSWDVTIFCCNGNHFAFRRSRLGLKGLDWRSEQDFNLTSAEWLYFELSDYYSSHLDGLMGVLGVDFGRFDFMTEDNTDKLVFLEFNATGQWVFLDYQNKYGLRSTVIQWLAE